MKRLQSAATRGLALLSLGLLAGTAHAHTGHGVTGFMEGLVHPLGLDHLLAMVAVGVWSVKAWPAHQVWRGPMAFMSALLVFGALGTSGWTPPFLEHMIALSVALFGLMLVVGARGMPVGVALGMIAFAGGLHGWAHGAETPESGFATYALGFVLTTAALHAAGVLVGAGIREALAQRKDWVTPVLGLALSATGVYLVGQI